MRRLPLSSFVLNARSVRDFPPRRARFRRTHACALHHLDTFMSVRGHQQVDSGCRRARAGSARRHGVDLQPFAARLPTKNSGNLPNLRYRWHTVLNERKTNLDYCCTAVCSNKMISEGSVQTATRREGGETHAFLCSVFIHRHLYNRRGWLPSFCTRLNIRRMICYRQKTCFEPRESGPPKPTVYRYTCTNHSTYR